MMTDAQLSRLKAWFSDYTGSFLTGDARCDGPLVLKIDHTRRVCADMRMLAGRMALSKDHLNLAEAVGLLHDLGRFEQYRRYRTFNDLKSVNHAALGVDILKQRQVLQGLEPMDQLLIHDSVRFHNAPTLPSTKAPLNMLFMHLIRDADKLDIWKIFADCYRNQRSPEPAVFQHLPDLPLWTDAVIDAIDKQLVARFKDMHTLNDFKLLKLSWIFDLNFTERFTQVQRRGDLHAIAASLPEAPDIRRAVAVVMKRLDEMVSLAPN